MNRHIKGKYGWIKHFDFLLLDIVALIISFPIGCLIRYGNFYQITRLSGKTMCVICIMVDIAVILISGFFSGVLRRYGSEEFVKTVKHVLINAGLSCILLFMIIRDSGFSRTVLLLSYVVYLLISFVTRQLWKISIRKGKVKSIGNSKKTIVVVGKYADMPRILRSINSGFFREYDIKGLCIPDAAIGEKIDSRIDVIGEHGKAVETYETFENVVPLSNLADFVISHNVEEVFIGLNPSEISREIYQKLISNAKGIHLDIEPMLGFKTDEQFITTVGVHKTLSVGVYSFTGKQMTYLVIKRLMDLFFGIVGVLCMLPLMMVIKISYLLSGDKKSIFYTHTRIGLNGQKFKMYKFRSMVCNADEQLKELLKNPKYKKEWEENQKFEDDPRITKIGGFLRKTSLDEIPQFLNVLKGDMSLIGPRPLVEGELEMHNGLQLYNIVRPGVTGWWGCNGRSNTTYDERLELEYYYVKNCSLYLDVLCIVKTIAAILKRNGAK